MHDPLHQFVISPILGINICGLDLSFTDSALSVFVAVSLVCTILTIGVRTKLVPGRLQALVEMSHGFITDMIEDNIGKDGRRYFPFVFSIFFFILFGNLIGMIPHMFTFTSHIIVTFVLAMVVFLSVTILGIVLHGFHFFSLFVPSDVPKPLLLLLVPIEIISYLTRPVSLAVRLFANIMSGHIMMKILAGFSVMMGSWSGVFSACEVVPIFVNVVLTGFEIVVAVLQSYVFAVLTCLYLNDAIHLH